MPTAIRSRCSSCPEFWVGGGGEKVTLRIAARHADKTNWQTGLDGFVHKSKLLEQYCDEIGRDFSDIVRTHGPDCRIFDTDADGAGLARLARRRQPLGPGRRSTTTCATTSSARSSRSREKVQAYVDAGCREFVLWLRDYPSDETLRRWITEVVPRLVPRT